jgi:hypothetical protein
MRIAIEVQPSAASQLDLDARCWTFNDERGASRAMTANRSPAAWPLSDQAAPA